MYVLFTKGSKNHPIKAEVVGFKDENILLMPYVEASNISPGSLVEATGESLKVKVGTGLIGQVVDAFGDPLDGSMLPKGLAPVSTEQSPPNPMDRPPIRVKNGRWCQSDRQLAHSRHWSKNWHIRGKRCW